MAAYLEEHHTDGASLEDAVRLAVSALGHTEEGDRVIPDDDLEVAVLDRTRSQPRKFSRIMPARLRQLLGDRGPTEPNPEPEVEHTVPPPESAADRRLPIAPPG